MSVYITNERIIDALRKKKWIGQAAEEVPCSRRTIEKRIADSAEVAEVYREVKESRTDKVETRLQDLIDDGNIAAIIFYLKTQAKERGYVERQEITGADGGPVVIVNWDNAEDSHPS